MPKTAKLGSAKPSKSALKQQQDPRRASQSYHSIPPPVDRSHLHSPYRTQDPVTEQRVEMDRLRSQIKALEARVLVTEDLERQVAAL